jgi:hypothetical protein
MEIITGITKEAEDFLKQANSPPPPSAGNKQASDGSDLFEKEKSTLKNPALYQNMLKYFLTTMLLTTGLRVGGRAWERLKERKPLKPLKDKDVDFPIFSFKHAEDDSNKAIEGILSREDSKPPVRGTQSHSGPDNKTLSIVLPVLAATLGLPAGWALGEKLMDTQQTAESFATLKGKRRDLNNAITKLMYLNSGDNVQRDIFAPYKAQIKLSSEKAGSDDDESESGWWETFKEVVADNYKTWALLSTPLAGIIGYSYGTKSDPERIKYDKAKKHLRSMMARENLVPRTEAFHAEIPVEDQKEIQEWLRKDL